MSAIGYRIPINSEHSAFAISNYLSKCQQEAYNVHVDSILRNHIGNVLLASEEMQDLRTARLILDIVNIYPGAGRNVGEAFLMVFLHTPHIEVDNYLKMLLDIVKSGLGEIFFKCASTQKSDYYDVHLLIEMITAFRQLIPHLPKFHYSFSHFLPYDQGGKEVLEELMKNPKSNLADLITKDNDFKLVKKETRRNPLDKTAKFQERLKVFQELSSQDTFLNKLGVYLNNLKCVSTSKIDFEKLSLKNRLIAQEALKLLATYSDCTMLWKVVASKLADAVRDAMINDFTVNFKENREPFWEKYLDPSGRGLIHYLSELIKIDLNPVKSNPLIGRHPHTAQKVNGTVMLHINFLSDETSDSKTFQEISVTSSEASLGLEMQLSKLAVESLSVMPTSDQNSSNEIEMDEISYQDFYSRFSLCKQDKG